MDAITYFFFNSGILLFILGLLAFLLGLLLGRFLWGPYKRTWIVNKQRHEQIENELNISKQNNIESQREISKLKSSYQTEVADCTEQLAKAKNKISELENALEKSADGADDSTTRSGFMGDATDSVPGTVEDEKLGFIYTEKPEQEDDLTKIKGVASVLNQKLNDFGVYTYRQIANWSDAVIKEFSERLSFKDRVERDDWKGQARKLHKQKYGEDI